MYKHIHKYRQFYKIKKRQKEMAGVDRSFSKPSSSTECAMENGVDLRVLESTLQVFPGPSAV